MITHKNPLISIIIPTFNRANLLHDTLQSVLLQTYQNWECIIVDDGCTDQTEQIVKKFVEKDSRYRYERRPAEFYKSGGNGARNFGFSISKGKYVNWFDDDDIMLPNFLEVKIGAFKDELELVIAPGHYWIPEMNKETIMDVKITNSLYEDYSFWTAHIITNSVLFKKEFLIDKALFSEKIVRGQETELFSRLFFQLPINKFAIINISTFLYRQHEITKSSISKTYQPEFIKSGVYINTEGFIRSKKLKNKLLTREIYHRILKYLFISIENHDINNVDFIIKEFFPVLKKYNFFVAIQFKLLGKLSYKMKFFYDFSVRYLWRLI